MPLAGERLQILVYTHSVGNSEFDIITCGSLPRFAAWKNKCPLTQF